MPRLQTGGAASPAARFVRDKDADSALQQADEKSLFAGKSDDPAGDARIREALARLAATKH